MLKALFRHDLLPRIISGSSAGAIVAGIIAVGASAYGNLSLRREHADLQTSANRWHFNAGVAYCIFGVAFILFPVL